MRHFIKYLLTSFVVHLSQVLFLLRSDFSFKGDFSIHRIYWPKVKLTLIVFYSLKVFKVIEDSLGENSYSRLK